MIYLAILAIDVIALNLLIPVYVQSHLFQLDGKVREVVVIIYIQDL